MFVSFGFPKVQLKKDIAKEIVEKSVAILTWVDPKCVGKIIDHSLVKSSTQRLWHLFAGCDAVKYGHQRRGYLRQKGAVDADHLTAFIKMFSDTGLADRDSIVMVSGRNSHIFKEMTKEINKLRPRVCATRMQLQPCDADVLKLVRAEKPTLAVWMVSISIWTS